MPTRFALLAVFAVVGCFGWSTPSRAQEPSDASAPAIEVDQSCDHPRPFWFRTDYLLWWLKSAPMPVLLTTDPTNGATPTAGGLGDPTTQVALGGGASFNPAPGVRFELGFPLCENVSLVGSGFVLGTERVTRTVGSDTGGTPFLFRPFVNVDTGNVNAGGFVSLPGLVAGTFAASSQIQLWGLDPHAYFRAYDSGGVRFGWIAGFRYLDLQESLDLFDTRTLLAGGGSFNGMFTAPGDRLQLVDAFKTHNQFWGGQIGAHGEAEWGRLVLSGDLRVSLGGMDELVDVLGSTKYFPVGSGSSFIAPGGLLALPSNTGHHNASDFVIVPELSLGAGYQLTSLIRLSFGYDFMYLSRVVRPGDQVPLVVSASQIPTSPSFAGATATVPESVANRADFWAQGIHAELTIRY